jgi:predicted O-methyltransferase YrrM
MLTLVAPEIEHYAQQHSSPEPAHLVKLAEETQATTAAPQMMTGHLEGRLLKTLVAATGARRVLEIGTFTGYSALSMAEGLREGGTIVTCEIDAHHAEIAQRHIAASPYADSIEIRLGAALDTIATLDAPIDFVFIDADKVNYANYYEAVLPLLSPDGLIAVDNVLWSGNVLRPSDDPNTRAIIEFNEQVRNDPRVECVMLTVRDGITLIRRHPG